MFLYAQNDPIIESSNNIVFAPYNLEYPHLKEQMEEAGLTCTNNRWDVIFDFTEKKEEGTNVNFSILAPEEFALKKIEIEGDDFPPFHLPVPVKFGGDLPDNDLTA